MTTWNADAIRAGSLRPGSAFAGGAPLWRASTWLREEPRRVPDATVPDPWIIEESEGDTHRDPRAPAELPVPGAPVAYEDPRTRQAEMPAPGSTVVVFDISPG